MKIKNNRIVIIITFLFLQTNIFAQDFAPLLKSPHLETIHFADQMDDKILALQSFDSHLRRSNDLDYDTLLMVMPLVDNVFSSLTFYNQIIHPVQELLFPSTKDSIFIYQNFLIRETESSIPSKEIVLFGTLLTPTVKTRVAIWLDEQLEEKRKIVYDPELYFYIKNNGVGAHFIINNKGNLVTNVNGSTIELNNNGDVVKRSEYLLGNNYFQNNDSTYLTPFPHGLSISDNNLEFIEFNEIKYPEYPNLGFLNYKFVFNLNEDYILYHSVIAFDFDCENGKSRNAIIKYNNNTYEAETFFIDTLNNCQKKNYLPQFSIDSFTEDYLYICRKYNSCGFINLDIYNGENICNTEFMEVQCIDKNGELRWRKELGGDASYWPRGIVATPDSGCVVFTNRYERGINTGYESDLYYTKLNKQGKIVQPIPVSVAEPNSTNQSSQTFVYPNPVKDVLFVSYPIQNSTKSVWIEIYDLQGQLVLSQKVKDATINTAQLTNGIYSYTVKQDGQILNSDKLLKF